MYGAVFSVFLSTGMREHAVKPALMVVIGYVLARRRFPFRILVPLIPALVLFALPWLTLYKTVDVGEIGLAEKIVATNERLASVSVRARRRSSPFDRARHVRQAAVRMAGGTVCIRDRRRLLRGRDPAQSRLLRGVPDVPGSYAPTRRVAPGALFHEPEIGVGWSRGDSVLWSRVSADFGPWTWLGSFRPAGA